MMGNTLRYSIVVILFLFFIGRDALKAQSNSYPELKYTYLLNTTHAVNRLDDAQTASLNVVYQNYLNLLSEIKMVDFSGFIKVKEHHQLGLTANTFSEGPYINKTAAGGHYAFAVKIFRQSTLSAGIFTGFKSINLDGATSGVSGSSTVPDVSLNLLVRHPHYFIYYSANQLIGSKVKPGIAFIKLKRFHEVRTGVLLEPGLRIKLVPQLHLRIYEQARMSYGASISMKVYSILSFGIASYDLNTILFQTGLQLSGDKSWSLSLLGSYSQLIGKVPGSLLKNSMEIGLLISKKKTDNVYDEHE